MGQILRFTPHYPSSSRRYDAGTPLFCRQSEAGRRAGHAAPRFPPPPYCPSQGADPSHPDPISVGSEDSLNGKDGFPSVVPGSPPEARGVRGPLSWSGTSDDDAADARGGSSHPRSADRPAQRDWASPSDDADDDDAGVLAAVASRAVEAAVAPLAASAPVPRATARDAAAAAAAAKAAAGPTPEEREADARAKREEYARRQREERRVKVPEGWGGVLGHGTPGRRGASARAVGCCRPPPSLLPLAILLPREKREFERIERAEYGEDADLMRLPVMRRAAELARQLRRRAAKAAASAAARRRAAVVAVGKETEENGAGTTAGPAGGSCSGDVDADIVEGGLNLARLGDDDDEDDAPPPGTTADGGDSGSGDPALAPLPPPRPDDAVGDADGVVHLRDARRACGEGSRAWSLKPYQAR